MLFQLIFQPLVLLSTMQSLVDNIKHQIESFNPVEIYDTPGYVVEDQQLTYVLKASYDTATAICKNNRSKLFAVYEFQDLDDIFDFFNLTETWINVSKIKTNTLLDISGHYPVFNTKTQSILGDELKIEKMLDSTADRIILARNEDGVFKYRNKKANELVTGLCMQSVHFPYRQGDDVAISELKSNLLSKLQISKAEIALFKREAQVLWKKMVKITPNQTLEIEETKNIQEQVAHKINLEETKSRILLNKIKNVTDFVQILSIYTAFETLIEKIMVQANFVLNTIEKPIITLDDIFETVYLWTEEKKRPHELFVEEPDKFIIRIGYEKVQKLPGQNQNDNNFWNLDTFWQISFTDLMLIWVGIMTIFSIIGTTLYRYYGKRPLQIRQMQNRPVTVREKKYEHPMTGSCSNRRRHSIDLPTTLPRQILKKSELRKEREKRSMRVVSRREPTADMPLWAVSSDLSINN